MLENGGDGQKSELMGDRDEVWPIDHGYRLEKESLRPQPNWKQFGRT